ncbi:hypothetical protein AAFF_G00250700 [Aldrovandia affinis]|uniref:Uncharacterized protein n=1 Tax=Aldrovandia affinis TaxID=143900 RepID=A0AAD7RDC3_9TELE|nr:hypothetical protein AAFF_G00250700 [Aldrovandia affinis]
MLLFSDSWRERTDRSVSEHLEPSLEAVIERRVGFAWLTPRQPVRICSATFPVSPGPRRCCALLMKGGALW